MNNNSNGGIGFCGLLGIVFIILKLTGQIQWGWVYVLMPIWIPLAISAILLFIAGAIIAYVELFLK